MLTLPRNFKTRALSLASVILLFAAFVEVAAQQESRPATAPQFVSLEGRFSVSLPNQSSSRRLRIPTSLGYAVGNLYEWRIKEATFGVGYADFLQPITDPAAVKQFFDGATDRFKKLAGEHGGKIAPVKQITLDQHSGIEQRAELDGAWFIQRTLLVSRRIYETLVLVKNSQRDSAVKVLNSFRLLSDPQITEEALKVGPDPLPQTSETPRAGSDAGDEGLRGRVKSVRTEIQYGQGKPFSQDMTQTQLTSYNERGDKLRTESYDFKNNLSRITVYGYLDGYRVSASQFVQRDYSLPLARGGAGPKLSNKPMDPRYQHRFEYKYDEKNRLIEEADFLSNGDLLDRSAYKYEGNQKEEFVYLENGSLSRRKLSIFDDKGNEIESTNFSPDGSVFSKTTYTYEFDANGNWTKRTISSNVMSKKYPGLDNPKVYLRTITYY